MLSYNHIFHAGNHADILKHIALLSTILYFNKKEKPYVLIDTHAGSAKYNLCDDRAKKTLEAENGILKIINSNIQEIADDKFSNFFKYISFVKECLQNNFYPGSPEIAKNFMRENDKLILFELHKNEFELLKNNISYELNKKYNSHTKVDIQFFNKNSYEHLLAITPPQIKRGICFIDPSYEDANEYEKVSDVVRKTYERWQGATFIIWYPLLSHKKISRGVMLQKIISYVKTKNNNCDIIDVALCIDKESSHIETNREDLQKDNPPRLYGSGLLIINPTWELDNELSNILPFILKYIDSEHKGSVQITKK